MSYELGKSPTPGLGRLTPDTTYLQLRNGPQQGLEIALSSLSLLVGRNNPPHTQVDIDLSLCELGDPPMISRQHALLQWVEGNLQIADLNSRNGSWVNGQKLEPSLFVNLSLGNLIKLGNLEFEVISHD